MNTTQSYQYTLKNSSPSAQFFADRLWRTILRWLSPSIIHIPTDPVTSFRGRVASHQPTRSKVATGQWDILIP